MLSRDFDEKEIYKTMPRLLEILLYDHNTKGNIIWGTDNYKKKGPGYREKDFITIPLIVHGNTRVIKPRVDKSKIEQNKRSKDNAEVFTPSWVCNKQNNLVDEAWFGRKDVFNIEQDKTWVQTNFIEFNNDKTWKDYVKELRLEITCGEAPYIVSRYDTVTGEMIDINNRIGLLDRKIRVVNENAITNDEWLEYVIIAFKSVYGFEFQGDNLLIARENLILTFIDYYENRFGFEPSEEILLKIAEIISWNFWQMDGLKMVVPYSCHEETIYQLSLFDDVKPDFCKGCKTGNVKQHNGKRCYVMDWEKNKKVKFLDLMR